MNLATAAKLGRISNLPTVWSNVLAGLVLVGAPIFTTTPLVLTLAATLFYVGGMFLNDAYDAEVDAKERAERPIPAGEVERATVFAWGHGMLAAGLGLTTLLGMRVFVAALATAGTSFRGFVVPTEKLLGLFFAGIVRRPGLGRLLAELLTSDGHEIYTCFFDAPGLGFQIAKPAGLRGEVGPLLRGLFELGQCGGAGYRAENAGVQPEERHRELRMT